MHKGDKFVIGKPSWLLCECTSVDGDIACCTVINGAWDFTLNLITRQMTWFSPMGMNTRNISKDPIYYGPWPERGDYNDVMYYADRMMGYPAIVRSIIVGAHRIKKFATRFVKAIKAARNAFTRSWSPKNAWESDEIPF